ncbi:MAG: hypothetical protein OXI87_20745 [Albidovulum sp.]|nr:hypothetical protein [Albidovulum sp.]MDE0534468.1 hypothetical protein [Albidovulum sp.]
MTRIAFAGFRRETSTSCSIFEFPSEVELESPPDHVLAATAEEIN